MINLDTHILVHAFAGSLRAVEHDILARHPWGVSAIVLWELAKLHQLGRIALDMQDRTVRRAINRLHIWPITLEIAAQSTQMDFRGDPADELIAATSVVHEAPLMTRDAELRGSQLVTLATLA